MHICVSIPEFGGTRVPKYLSAINQSVSTGEYRSARARSQSWPQCSLRLDHMFPLYYKQVSHSHSDGQKVSSYSHPRVWSKHNICQFPHKRRGFYQFFTCSTSDQSVVVEGLSCQDRVQFHLTPLVHWSKGAFLVTPRFRTNGGSLLAPEPTRVNICVGNLWPDRVWRNRFNHMFYLGHSSPLAHQSQHSTMLYF